MKKNLFLVLFLIPLLAFPPRDEKVFQLNCLRLLNNSQYSFLVDYFANYYFKFSKSSQFDYIEKIINQLPFSSQKAKIIEIYLKNNQKPNNRLHYIKGQVLLLQNKPEKALSEFLKYRGQFHDFYIGVAYQRAGNFIDAEKKFLQILKNIKNQLLQQQIYILLTDIYLKWGEKKKAAEQVKKIKNSQVKKTYQKKL